MISSKCFLAEETANKKHLVKICFNPIGQGNKRYAFYKGRSVRIYNYRYMKHLGIKK